MMDQAALLTLQVDTLRTTLASLMAKIDTAATIGTDYAVTLSPNQQFTVTNVSAPRHGVQFVDLDGHDRVIFWGDHVVVHGRVAAMETLLAAGEITIVPV